MRVVYHTWQQQQKLNYFALPVVSVDVKLLFSSPLPLPQCLLTQSCKLCVQFLFFSQWAYFHRVQTNDQGPVFTAN